MLFMDINDLIAIVKKKLQNNILIEKINIEDKSFLHKNHSGNQKGKFHLKITISSDELKKLSRIERNKKVYKVLDLELKQFIHSLQILIQ
jgi:BolA protein